MRADNTHHVVAAAKRRAEQTRQRALATLRRMDATGQRVTFDAVAREAGVSRSWLYSQQDLRAEIERLRRRHPAATAVPLPPQRQRASEPALLRRLEARPLASATSRTTTSNSALRSLKPSANAGPLTCSDDRALLTCFPHERLGPRRQAL